MNNSHPPHKKPGVRFRKNRSFWPVVLAAVVFALLGSILLFRSFAVNANLPGDLDGSNKVEQADLTALLSTWNQASTANDLNGDGTIGIIDLSILLSHWNQTSNQEPTTPTPPTPPNENLGTPTATIKIMPLGSSSITGDGSSKGAGFRPELYTKLTQDERLKVDFVGSQTNGPTSGFDRDHEGHSGWYIGNNESLSAGVTGWMNTYSPDIILFYAGMNDLRSGASGADTAARFDAIAGKIFAAKPEVRLIAATTMHPFDDAALATKVRDYNTRMEPVAKKYRDAGRYLQVIDLDAVITASDHADSIHANDAGYSKMVPVWLSGIRATYPTFK
jgi:hypothetical protein